jgi:hypothetical protein
VLAGALFYLCYALPASYLGSKAGQTYSLLTTSVFGLVGSAIAGKAEEVGEDADDREDRADQHHVVPAERPVVPGRQQVEGEPIQPAATPIGSSDMITAFARYLIARW